LLQDNNLLVDFGFLLDEHFLLEVLELLLQDFPLLIEFYVLALKLTSDLLFEGLLETGCEQREVLEFTVDGLEFVKQLITFLNDDAFRLLLDDLSELGNLEFQLLDLSILRGDLLLLEVEDQCASLQARSEFLLRELVEGSMQVVDTVFQIVYGDHEP
jgi:hypothetical protein